MRYGWLYIVEATVWALVCLVALWRGGAVVRWVATANLLNLFILLAFGHLQTPYRVHWLSLGCDAAVLAVCLGLLKYSRAAWLLVAISAQLLSLLTHLAKAIDPSLGGWAYVTLDDLWGVLMLGSMSVGTLRERRG